MRIVIDNCYSFVICTLLKRKVMVMVCPPLPMRKNEKITALGNGLAQCRIYFAENDLYYGKRVDNQSRGRGKA